MTRFRMNCPGKGEVIVTVDDDIAPLLRAQMWRARFTKNTQSYHVYLSVGGRAESLARKILDIDDERKEARFINGNSLDLRRSNMRVVTYQEKMAEVRASRDMLRKVLNVCKRGHRMTPDNTYRNGKCGQILCKTCRNAWSRARRNAVGKPEGVPA